MDGPCSRIRPWSVGQFDTELVRADQATGWPAAALPTPAGGPWHSAPFAMSLVNRGRVPHDVQALGGLAPGGDRSAEVPLDVDETGGLDDPDHERRLVQDEVEVDLVAEPLVEVADLGSGVQAEDQPSAGSERADQGRDRVGQLGGRQVDERVPPQDGRPPGLVAGRLSRRRSPTSKVRPGKRRRASATIAGERSMPVASAPPSARYAVTCPGPEPTSTTGSSGGVGEHPVQQPALERQPAARRRGGRRRRWRRRRTTTAPCVAHLGAAGDHGVPVDGGRGGGRGLLRDRSEEMDPAAVLLPGSPFELADQRLRRSAIRRRHASTSARSANACSRSVRVRSSPGACAPAEQQHREQRPLVGVEPEPLVEDLVVLQRPPPGVGPHDPQQPALLERPRGPLDRLLVEVDDGLAIARLVAGGSAARWPSAGTTPAPSSASPAGCRGCAALRARGREARSP